MRLSIILLVVFTFLVGMLVVSVGQKIVALVDMLPPDSCYTMNGLKAEGVILMVAFAGFISLLLWVVHT